MKSVNSPENKPILVTGLHRSGSTWVGKMLALPSQVAYIHEPFSLYCSPGICKAKFEYWFPYISEQNSSLYSNDLESTFRYDYHLIESLRAAKSVKDVLRCLRDYSRFANFRLSSSRPLIKDPIAFFSADWLAKHFDMSVVVLVRHPAAFAASLKKARWSHSFSDFLEQPLLMDHYLENYRSQIEAYSSSEQDIVDQAILLWNLFNHVILIYKEKHPDWLFVKHEELSKQPVEEFSRLYKDLGLSYSEAVRKEIGGFSHAVSKKRKSLSGNNAQPDVFDVKRDSKSNIFKWKTILTAEEVDRVREKTYEIASKFYAEEDWIPELQPVQ